MKVLKIICKISGFLMFLVFVAAYLLITLGNHIGVYKFLASIPIGYFVALHLVGLLICAVGLNIDEVIDLLPGRDKRISERHTID
jgi:hypothetical protein